MLFMHRGDKMQKNKGFSLSIFLFLTLVNFFLFFGCSDSRVVQSHYIISNNEEEIGCNYTWQTGDYWEFLAWALLDDVTGASALAITAGYSPDQLPSPDTDITIPIPVEFEEAAEYRMKAARIVEEATEIRETDRSEAMSLLREAARTDPSWSVPLTNMAVLFLEDENVDDALSILQPVAHKNTPAHILACIAWNEGDTDTALNYLAEALVAQSPAPEVLAAVGIAYGITGDVELASSAINRLLENPDAPAELRILVLEYAIRLAE